jgi:hypothetical protein
MPVYEERKYKKKKKKKKKKEKKQGAPARQQPKPGEGFEACTWVTDTAMARLVSRSA